MALKIEKGDPMKKPKPPLTADRRLFLDHTRERVVEDGTADAAYLLVGAGCELAAEEAERLGVRMVDGKLRQEQKPAAKPDTRIGKQASPPVAGAPARASKPRKPKKE